MYPVLFPEANSRIGVDVPVNRSHGILLSRWRLSWLERLSVLLRGYVWLAVKGDTQPPILLTGYERFSIESRVEFEEEA